ncbi:hypothetical protein EV182_005028, partial [Spiromyces aspiralis]
MGEQALLGFFITFESEGIDNLSLVYPPELIAWGEQILDPKEDVEEVGQQHQQQQTDGTSAEPAHEDEAVHGDLQHSAASPGSVPDVKTIAGEAKFGQSARERESLYSGGNSGRISRDSTADYAGNAQPPKPVDAAVGSAHHH